MEVGHSRHDQTAQRLSEQEESRRQLRQALGLSIHTARTNTNSFGNLTAPCLAMNRLP